MTVVREVLRRVVGFDSFTDLTPSLVTSIAPDAGWVTVTFADTLDQATQDRVAARISSTDDADLADRDAVAALVAQVTPGTPLADLVLRLANHRLNT